MSLVIGKPRSVSHSCLVRASIEMPVELEDDIRNLDDIFQEQLTAFNAARDYITKELSHPIMENWSYISDLLEACKIRMKVIVPGDYMRAMSYGAMRIVNTRMTDVLNAIMPVKNFMEHSIRKEEERLKKEKEEAEMMEELKGIVEEIIKAIEVVDLLREKEQKEQIELEDIVEGMIRILEAPEVLAKKIDVQKDEALADAGEIVILEKSEEMKVLNMLVFENNIKKTKKSQLEKKAKNKWFHCWKFNA
ncbi:unnamed protein product [Caenorhabditis sp. 36 PRJEB53466]|nr:unnamed protein product [Caenorhabditis sp. 36 PRJEB53466]